MHGPPTSRPKSSAFPSGTIWELPGTTPILVVNGAQEFRIVELQELETFNALQRRGIPSQLLFFPDENHWVLKPANSVLWHETVIGWLDRWVK
jgi:dipeptidyl aminopeptidase/acylaminoacyl peptidase